MRACLGCYSLNDLLLQHKMHVLDDIPMCDQVKQYRGRNIVGKVADDAQFSLAKMTANEFRKIEIENIGVMNVQIAAAFEFIESGYDVTIQLDNIQASHGI